MAFGQRHAAAVAAKKSKPSVAADIESSGGDYLTNSVKQEDVDYDNKKYRPRKRHAKTFVLFTMALSLGFLSGWKDLAALISRAKVVTTKRQNGGWQRQANQRLREQNKYGFTLNMNDLPEDWTTWSFGRIRRRFKCDDYVDNAIKPVPSMGYWNIIRDAYKNQVDPSFEFDALVPPTQGYRFNEAGEGPPYYAKLSESKDRGLYASRDIAKGEIVHDGRKSDVVFPDAMAWRRFVLALPRKAACDFTEWTWTQRLEEGGQMRLLTALDISAMMNNGTPEQINAMPKSSTSSVFYATRDIKKGEEILTDYDMYETRFDLAGLDNDDVVSSECNCLD